MIFFSILSKNVQTNNWICVHVKQNKMNEVLLRCKAEVDATDEDVEVFKRGQIPTSYSGLCLLTCLYEHTGIVRLSLICRSYHSREWMRLSFRPINV